MAAGVDEELFVPSRGSCAVCQLPAGLADLRAEVASAADNLGAVLTPTLPDGRQLHCQSRGPYRQLGRAPWRRERTVRSWSLVARSSQRVTGPPPRREASVGP